MYLLLANPTSGGGKGREFANRIRKVLVDNRVKFNDVSGSSYESSLTSLSLAMEATEQIEGVIVVGGDGMAHLALQVLANRSIPMALIPAGTGNDLARSLELPLDNPERILAALANEPIEIDLGIVNGEYFADILSTGFDSVVNERANRMRKITGPMKYNVSILLELPIFKPMQYEFILDDQRFTREAMLIAVANGPCYGGGMKVCPDARLDDGLFDVMILEPVSKIEFLRVFPKVFKGAHVTHPKVEIRRAKRVEINAAAVAYADGERIGPLPVIAEVVPKALKVWRI